MGSHKSQRSSCQSVDVQVRCPKCENGKIKIPMQCSSCNGNSPNGSSCNSCNGCGLVLVETNCSDCGGSGWLTVRC